MIIGLENKYVFDEAEGEGVLRSSMPMNHEIEMNEVTEENLLSSGFKNVVIAEDSFFSTTKIDGTELPGSDDVIEYFFTE